MKCTCRAHGSFLTAKGLEEAAQRTSLEGLAPFGELEYVDNRVSVSAMGEGEDLYEYHSDLAIDEQARRFHNGC